MKNDVNGLRKSGSNSSAGITSKQKPKPKPGAGVAEVLGVSREAVKKWFAKKTGSNDTSINTSKPKTEARVKVPAERKPEIAERIEAGEDREQVADWFRKKNGSNDNSVNTSKPDARVWPKCWG